MAPGRAALVQEHYPEICWNEMGGRFGAKSRYAVFARCKGTFLFTLEKCHLDDLNDLFNVHVYVACC